MADDITYTSTSPAGPPNATKQVTDEHATRGHMPVVKIAVSADADATLVSASATDGLLVNLGANNDVTVTGTVTANAGTGTLAVDSELPAAAALADNASNPTAPAVGAFGMLWDGATWDRVSGTSTDGQLVNLGANNDVTVTSGSVSLSAAIPAGTNNIGDVDVLSLPAATVAGAASLPAGTNNIGDVDVLSLPALPAGANNIGDVDVASFAAGAITEVQGDVAHDAAAAGNPVLVGFRANANEPAAVSADADAVYGWADLLGRQVVITGHPNPEPPVTVNATASGATTVIAAPGASLSLYVTKASVHNRDTTNRVVDLRDGAAGTVRWRAEIAAEGGGSIIDFGERGWKLTANTLLAVNLDAAGNVDVNVTAYYIAA